MKVLVTGRGTSGSWAIRGEQLGAAIGATVERQAAKVKGYDLAVIVKRAPTDLLHRIRQSGVPLVWDVVDSWPQPIGNQWSRDDCMGWLRGQVAQLKPMAIVAATQAMAKDCAEFGLPVLALPHHARPGQRINPIRERVQKVAFEGGEQYLGSWRAVLDAECKRRKWSFEINPTSLADADIVVALREATGYAPRSWKSGIKLANAAGSGSPCVLNREQGYLENATGGEMWADTAAELTAALDVLTDQDARKAAANGLWAPQLHEVAVKYRDWLSRLVLNA